MTDLGWIGVWLLVIAAVLILLEMVLAGIWTARLAVHTRELSQRIVSEQAQIQDELAKLRAAFAEAGLLWQPYARILRIVNHPLVIALMQSYARRRAAAR